MLVKFATTTKRENSTYQPTMTKEVNVVLKSASSVITPTLELDRSAISHEYNYCYIADFNRYYFVKDIIYNGAKVNYYLSCDVLASFKTAIGNSSMYVTRAAADWNGDIIDTMYPCKTTHYLDYRTITNPFAVTQFSQGRYVVGIRGNGSGSQDGGVSYYMMNEAYFRDFVTDLLSDDFANQIISGYSITSNELKMLVDPLQYIDSVIWLPFTSTEGTALTSSSTIVVGCGTIDGPADATKVCYYISGTTFDKITEYFTVQLTSNLRQHPDASTRGSYLNSDTFSTCTFYIAPFGRFNLNLAKIYSMDSSPTVNAEIQVDKRTGDATLDIVVYHTGTGGVRIDDEVIKHATANLAVNIPLSQTIKAGTTTAWQDLAIIASSLGNIPNPRGVIGAFNNAMMTEGKSRIPELRKQGQTNNILDVYAEFYSYLQYDFLMPVQDDKTQRGRPLCEVRTLNTLTGYQVIADADVQINGTAEEAQMIKRYLESGYFYE